MNLLYGSNYSSQLALDMWADFTAIRNPIKSYISRAFFPFCMQGTRMKFLDKIFLFSYFVNFSMIITKDGFLKSQGCRGQSHVHANVKH